MTDLYTGIIDLAHMDQDVLVSEHANHGVNAVVLKVCTGVGCPDDRFVARFGEAVNLGMLVSGYAFLTGQHPGEQQFADLRKYWDAACAQHGIDPTSRPIWGDYEENPSGSKATPEVARAFLAAGREAGYNVGIYCGEDNGCVSFPDVNDAVGTYPLWLAAYGPDPRTEHVPPPWRATGWTMAQYTNDGAGPSDQTTFPRSGCDRSCYRGDLAALTAYWNSKPYHG